MAYPNAHLYLRIGGHFGASADQVDHWSSGLRIGVVGADIHYNAAQLQTFCDAAYAAVDSVHNSGSVYSGAACFFDWVTVARVGTDGKYDPAIQDTTRKDGTPKPGASATHLPWNTALVLSLRTAIPRGYASNGRFYYPATSMPFNAVTGRADQAETQARVGRLKDMINLINTAAAAYATNARVLVISSVGAGRAAVVTEVRSDTRLDSIERRENAMPPDWKTATVA